jgi:hypothetical protein
MPAVVISWPERRQVVYLRQSRFPARASTSLLIPQFFGATDNSPSTLDQSATSSRKYVLK